VIARTNNVAQIKFDLIDVMCFLGLLFFGVRD
jgi:hypothetical protein